MRVGGSKQKGSGFEREICIALSKWVSHGDRQDLYWRSAMSGGRATLGKKKGLDLRYQSGDISAVHPDGHVLTDYWYIECKFLRDIQLFRFVMGLGGDLQNYWNVASTEAMDHSRKPMVIVKQNRFPILVLVPSDQTSYFDWINASVQASLPLLAVNILSFDKMVSCMFSSKVKK